VYTSHRPPTNNTLHHLIIHHNAGSERLYLKISNGATCIDLKKIKNKKMRIPQGAIPGAIKISLILLWAVEGNAQNFLGCISQELPGPCFGGPTCESIPAHNYIYELSDGRGQCIGGPFTGDCVESIGLPADSGNFECTNGNVGATMWITPDQCLNLDVDGIHHFCCSPSLCPGIGCFASCQVS
jgi:hypothetical protein